MLRLYADKKFDGMRDRRFVAEHHGGPLKKERHIQLMLWGVACAEHALGLLDAPVDTRLLYALEVAKAWTQGETSVGDARKAAVQCHAVARESPDPVTVAVAHACGHAVATAHMADHALGPAWYGLRAVKAKGGVVEEERRWQNAQLPSEIRALVLSARENRRI